MMKVSSLEQFSIAANTGTNEDDPANMGGVCIDSFTVTVCSMKI